MSKGIAPRNKSTDATHAIQSLFWLLQSWAPGLVIEPPSAMTYLGADALSPYLGNATQTPFTRAMRPRRRFLLEMVVHATSVTHRCPCLSFDHRVSATSTMYAVQTAFRSVLKCPIHPFSGAYSSPLLECCSTLSPLNDSRCKGT